MQTVENRIKTRTEEILSEAQADFRKNRSTIDQNFILRQIAENYEEFGKDLYVCYFDFRITPLSKSSVNTGQTY